MTRGLGRFLRQNTIALLALFVALGGTSFAAATLINGSQIKPHTIAKNRLTNRAIAQLRGNRGPAGPAGPAGQRGPTGPQGPATGPAGGDLTGNYPNPSIKAGIIGAGKLGTINEESADSGPIGPGTSGEASVQCNAGEKVLSGGNDAFLSGPYIVASRFDSPNGWAVFGYNATGSTLSITVHAYCLAP
jgi:hypothetical protein